MGDIIIHGLRCNDLRITNKVEVSEELKKYFKSSEMFVEFNDEIYANESIQNIPLLSTVLPLAWLSGSNIHVEKLDKTFKESMDNIQLYFKELYPLAPFTTKILCEELVDNQIEIENPERRTGLLFSGGIDSTYSMLTNLHLKPRLLMHWGVERTPYPVNRDYWETVIYTYSEIADKLGLTFNVIKTNAMEVLHPRRIEHRFHKELFYGSFWVRLQHSFVMLSLVAPLSVNRFDQLLIAASGWPAPFDPLYRFHPYPQVAESDEKIAWARLKVKHDGYIARYKKTRFIADQYGNAGTLLRVCLNHKDTQESLNCNYCDKCFRTIAQLVLSKVDPNNFGFKVTRSTWEDMKSFYIHKKELLHSDVNTQNAIPEDIEFDLFGSKDYFEWFREFKTLELGDVWIYRDLYYYLPYPLAKALNEVYKIIKIDIHKDPTPRLPKHKIDYLLKKIIYVRPDWSEHKGP